MFKVDSRLIIIIKDWFALPLSTIILWWVITDVDVTSNLVVRLIVAVLEAVDDGLVREVQVQRLRQVQEDLLWRQQVDQLGAFRGTEHCHAFVCCFVRLEEEMEWFD